MRPPLKPSSRRALALVLVLVAAALIALGTLRVQRQHQLVKLGYELSEATAELRQIHEENRRLRLELSVLTAPERIEQLAEDMGLRPPAPGQVRAIGERPRPDARDPEDRSAE
jgi:cell division protein FtsL